MGFADADAETLRVVRRNLLAGLALVAEHIEAGTFRTIAPGRSTPPSESGQLTLALLRQVDAELARRAAVVVPGR